MALALLRRTGRDGEQVLFTIELGRNRYYSYAIGDGEVDRSGGFPVLLNRKVTSPVLGPIQDHPSGRATMAVPAEAFDRENRWIQLASFRTADREGPAVSEVLMVLPSAASRRDLPTISFETGLHMEHATSRNPVPFALSEARPMTSAMFLDALLPFLQRALPAVRDIVPAIAGLLGEGGGGAGPAEAPPAVDQLLALLQQLLAQSAGTGAPAAKPAEATALAARDGYSHAQIVPAVLAAAPMLTQLMPLLQQVLTPETVKSLIGAVTPKEVIGAVTDSFKEIGKLGLENNKQLQDWLKKLDPGVDDPGLDGLLESMSLRSAVPLARSLGAPGTPEHAAAAEPRYRRVPGVTLEFTGAALLPIRGRERVCYRAGRALSFPLAVSSPKPICDGRLILLVKDPSTRAIVARQRVAFPEVAAGPIAQAPALAAEQVASLEPGRDWLVCAYLLWRDDKKQVLGTSRTQLVTLLGRYSFDRIEDEGPLVPLNDYVKHRDWWHKIWQGSFTSDFRRASLECKYYVAFDPERATHARMETLTKLDEPVERRLAGRLKTGFVVSPSALNHLLPLVSSHPRLNEDELAALRTPDFRARYQQAGRFKAELHGRPGASAAVWVYPEVKLQKVVLQEATRIGEDGQVRELAEHAVHVPVPAILHYIGARTTS